jgi:ATP-dependent DNA helicase RecG
VPADSTELSHFSFLSSRERDALASAGFTRVLDLLTHFPKRYEDRQQIDSFPMQATSSSACMRGSVVDIVSKNLRAGQICYEIVVLDSKGGVFGSSRITCRWFSPLYIHKVLAVGHEVFIYGRVKESGGRLIVDHPDVEIFTSAEQDFIHTERIVPIYRNITGVSQKKLREIIFQLLQEIEPLSVDIFGSVEVLSGRFASFSKIHFPKTLDEIPGAERRFVLEAQFITQLNVLWRRASYRAQAGRITGHKTTWLKQFYYSLPFDLTGAQKRCIKEIIHDMKSPNPMNRLLHGDVGSGKTFVAMAAMLVAIDSGCQAALMAPTQILAEQHYLTFVKWLDPIGIRVALKTSQRDTTLESPENEKPHIIIGTHSLIYKSVSFENLGFIVIDEQHKFGVAQRAALIQQGVLPDVLVMTATPIPRTLIMTVYGDLEVSILDEKPAGRARITTALRISPKQRDVTAFVKKQLSDGRQVYLVYPLVEESETLRAESAVEACLKWEKRLKPYQVRLLHGKMSAEEKEAIMSQFREGVIHALVATSVIEVGVDVPNASLMILHHAERFGLAQLHQLRGRVGRGGHKGYCIMLTDSDKPESLEKLNVLVNQSDGFLIAEEDLRLRGPGDVLGTIQSGLMGMKSASLFLDLPLIYQARKLASELLATDPTLNGEHASLRSLILSDALSIDLPQSA